MARNRWQAAHRDESGAYAVMFIAVLVIFVGASAVVVDLGSLYFSRHNAKTVADMASTAGALALEPSDDGSPYKGCQAAWEYTLANLADAPNNAASPCSAWDTSPPPTCDDPPSPVIGEAGPYTIVIVWPVDNDAGIMDDRVTAAIDGEACQRLAVDIRRHEGMLFAGFGGGPTAVDMGGASVSRYQSSTTGGDLVALVILEREACRAITTAGQGNVRVEAAEVTQVDDDGNEETFWVPGQITVDSSGLGGSGDNNCNTGTRYVIEASNHVDNYIIAEGTPDGIPGVILSHAALVGGRSHDPNACGPEDPTLTGPRPIQPCPLGGNRITREPIDHRYNCKSSYPFDISPCDDATSESAYIDRLRNHYAGSSAPTEGLFNGDDFSTYGGGDPGEPCVLNSSADQIELDDGNWFIDCPNTGGSGGTPGFRMTNNDASFTIGAGEIVFAGGIDVSAGEFTVGTTDQDSLLFVRRYADGSPAPCGAQAATRCTHLEKGADGQITLLNTFVYLANGVVAGGAQDNPVTWIAPVDDDYPFEDLLLWSEQESEHVLGGQGVLDLEGTFFTPNASPFRYNGGSAQSQTRAQFVTRRLRLSGQGGLLMRPDPERVTLFPVSGVKLIR